MNRPLRCAMVALVLVNLAFVQITESARWIWLGPLAALTLASPLLVRLTRFWAYRQAWNASLIGVFALLAHRFVHLGSQHLLEDGLLLAALCQVHLVNNVGDRQKPDLLFFNSFLIAVVTSFLSFDFAYSIVFLVYAPLLLLSMQLLTLSRAGSELTPAIFRRALLQGAARSVLALGLTLLVFFFAPRDFDRKGMLGERFSFRPPAGLAVGFTEQVHLDRRGSVDASDRVVMKVRLEGGEAAQVPVHWRGAALDLFDGVEWKPAWETAVLSERPWRRSRYGGWERGPRSRGARVEVELLRGTAGRLFVPLASRHVLPPQPSTFRPKQDLSFRGPPTARTVRYRLGFSVRRTAPRGPVGPVRAPAHVWLRSGAAPARASELASELRSKLPADAEQHEIVEALRQYLSTRYRYLRPGVEGGARTLHGFFFDADGGHCEIFASALVVMLRTLQIPCRLATGYASTEWDVDERVLTIRDRHAHAWVEVHDPAAGWYTVDPSPVSDAEASAATESVWDRARRWAVAFWEKVTGFNSGQRENVLGWLAALPTRGVAAARHHPVGFAAPVLFVLALFLFLRWRRRLRTPPPVRSYGRVLERLGLERRPDETPRELLERARDLDARGRQTLAAATRAHESARYTVG